MGNKMRFLAGMILFGSLWGFSETIIGSRLSDAGLPSGIIMTGFFAIMLLVLSRIVYKAPGMQLGMGLIAGTLRVFNPCVGCHLCSALAIMAEGVLFEIIWYKLSFDDVKLKTTINQVSMGVITTYTIFVGGYIVTQILTPIISGPGFYIENLLVFMPRILASGLPTAIIGGIVLPATYRLSKLDLKLKDQLYYPATLSISMICWVIVIVNWLVLMS